MATAPIVRESAHSSLRAAQKYARAFAIDAIRICKDIMDDDTNPARVRLVAAGMILDRAYGKPQQQVAFKDETPAKPIQIIEVNLNTESRAKVLQPSREPLAGTVEMDLEDGIYIPHIPHKKDPEENWYRGGSD